MALIPFGRGRQLSVADLQDEINRMFDRMWHRGLSTGPLDGQDWAPLVDLVDEAERYVLAAELPGMAVEDIEVSYEEGEVVIRGQKTAGLEPSEGRKFVQRERGSGSFCRRVAMPKQINADRISARCQMGVLEVVLPKEESAARHSIQVKVEE